MLKGRKVKKYTCTEQVSENQTVKAQMPKWEERMIERVNGWMVPIAMGFVFVAAVWIRMAGRNYVGNDFHYSLYDIPGNCNSLLYRRLADFLMLHFEDNAVVLLKYLAYAGDFAVALFAFLLMDGRRRRGESLRSLLILTACLLSPVPLLYSVSGMKPDSLCMSLLLAGMLLFRRGMLVSGALAAVWAGFLYPVYWPVSLGVVIYMAVQKHPEKRFPGQKLRVLLPAAAGLGIFAAAECFSRQGVLWGFRIFVTDPATGIYYDGFLQWLWGMCRIYGYVWAAGLTLLSFRYPRLRIPALFLQAAVIMCVGWQQTGHFAL